MLGFDFRQRLLEKQVLRTGQTSDPKKAADALKNLIHCGAVSPENAIKLGDMLANLEK